MQRNNLYMEGGIISRRQKVKDGLCNRLIGHVRLCAQSPTLLLFIYDCVARYRSNTIFKFANNVVMGNEKSRVREGD